MIVNLTADTSANVWKQERLVIKLTSIIEDVYFWTNISGSYDSPIAIYTPTTSGEVYIDVTDYLRTYASTITDFYVREYDSESQITLSVTIKGLINPENVIIPDNPLADYDALVVPPSFMYCTMDQSDLEQAEFYATSGTWSVTGSAAISTDSRYIGQIEGIFILSNGTNYKRYNPTSFRCGVRYALVKWVSFTGIERVHWFEVEKCKTATKSSYDLMPIDNEYVQIKGREDSFTLHLQGLNNYDLWYYADVLHSSSVEISLDGTNYDQVQVATSDITIPDGEAGTNGELDINVNWKRYDAVAM